MSFKEKYGPYALIAGASQGIGEAFAREIAKKGVNVILIARRENLLKKICNDIHEKHNVEAIPFSIDLTNKNLQDLLKDNLNPYEINLMVYNPALSPIGSFFEQSLALHEKTIDLNCRSPLILTHYFGKRMVKRGKGGIILMASMAGLQGSPVVAHYGATKAYNLNLAQALWWELRDKGVDLLACVAGATNTPNFQESNPQKSKGMNAPVMEPVEVAKQALKALPKDKPDVIPGTANKIGAFFMRHVFSRKKAIKTIGNINSQMYGFEKEE